MSGFEQTGVTKYFNQDPKTYAEDYGQETARGYSFRVRKERLLETLGKDPGKLLDIGCGPAVMTAEIAALGWEYAGMDIAEGMITEAKKRHSNNPTITFSVGSVEKIPAADNTFDVVVAMGLVEYFADDTAALKEMHRVLKPGGRLIVSIPNKVSPARMWDRFIIAPLGRMARAILHKPTPHLNHREYSPAVYADRLKKLGFGAPISSRAYNFRIIPRPFDLYLPKSVTSTGARLEPKLAGALWFFGTGVNIEVKKEISA